MNAAFKKEVFKKLIVQNIARIKQTKLIPREVPTKLFKSESPLIKALYGPRRSGKTYTIYQLIQFLLKKKKIAEEKIVYINFEDERILPLENIDGDLLLEAYHELYPGVKEAFLFLDEIQNLPNWDAFLRRLYEEKRYKIWVTGSSSVLMSEEIPTRLRGRALSVRIFPLSFREYLIFKGIEPPGKKSELLYGENPALKKALEEYIQKGGFPEAVSMDEDEKLDYLQQVLGSMFSRDIIERFEVKNHKLMGYLVKFFIENPSCYFSVNKTFKRFKSIFKSLSKETVIKYTGYIESAMLIDFVEPFSPFKERIILPKKVYLADTGLWWANCGFSVSENKGALLENAVYLHLLRTLTPGEKLYYLPVLNETFSGEIDFVVIKNGKITKAFQVCYELSKTETLERKLKAVSLFKNLFPNVQVEIITFKESLREALPEGVQVNPGWMWMLELS